MRNYLIKEIYSTEDSSKNWAHAERGTQSVYKYVCAVLDELGYSYDFGDEEELPDTLIYVDSGGNEVFRDDASIPFQVDLDTYTLFVEELK